MQCFPFFIKSSVLMNRRHRRAAAARARRAHRRTGYLHRLLAAQDAIHAIGTGKVVHLVCQHDPSCSIYVGRDCSCVPEMSAHPHGGNEMLLIDEDGKTTKVKAS
jgi:hypothetical protein